MRHLVIGSMHALQGIFGREERSFESFAVQKGTGALAAFLGNEGCIPLVSLKTRQSVGTLKMSGAARCAAFTGDGLGLWSLGTDGVLHQWDLRMRRCVARVADEGATNSTGLAYTDEGGGWLATGSDMGVVNLYRPSGLVSSASVAAGPLAAAPGTPAKALLNLTTTIDTLAFSPDGQMLAMASRMKRDSLRLVHLPSCTVFANWPTSKTPLGHVHSVAFSPGGGFMAIGNAKGRALLYRMHHYTTA